VLLRHFFAILVLPFTVTVIVPLWIARRAATTFAWPGDAGDLTLFALGVTALVIGAWLFVSTVRLFATRGRGTLAPWDPPKELVIEGPYRYVRHPMISGVLFLLLAEAAILRSMPHLRWAITFFVINAIYLPLIEEPMLVRRFGDAYREYCRHVGRLIPRTRP
jgi:protein-S-isoprenylcysteine O-methyltransferase Ste14